MSYSTDKESLVPLLGKCLLKHGSLKNVEEYPQKVRESGGDATVCSEFIALHEIRRYSESDEMIQSAFEVALAASRKALKEKDQLSSPEPSEEINREKFPFLAATLWVFIVIAALYFEDESVSPLLLSSIVLSGSYMICSRSNLRKT